MSLLLLRRRIRDEKEPKKVPKPVKEVEPKKEQPKKPVKKAKE